MGFSCGLVGFFFVVCVCVWMVIWNCCKGAEQGVTPSLQEMVASVWGGGSLSREVLHESLQANKRPSFPTWYISVSICH